MTLNRVSVQGDVYKRTEEAVPDNTPRRVREEAREERIIDTKLGMFITDEEQSTLATVDPFQALQLDFDEYKKVGTTEVSVIKARGAVFVESDSTRMLDVKSGNYLLVDVEEAAAALDLPQDELDAEELVLRVEERFKMGSDLGRDGFEFLASDFPSPIKQFEEATNPEPISNETWLYRVKRAAGTATRQRASLPEPLFEQLIEQNAVQNLELLGDPPLQS